MTVQQRALVIGAGPAGMSCAQWLHDLGVPFDWIEASDRCGGTLRRVGNPIRNLLGVAGHTGVTLAAHLADHVRDQGLAPSADEAVLELTPHEGGLRVRTTAREGVWAAVVLATGTEPRLLGLHGESELLGKDVHVSVTRHVDRYAGGRVVVVGGGDAALEGALLLARRETSVTLIHRRATFRGQARFVEEVTASPWIEVVLERTILKLLRSRDGALQGVMMNDGRFFETDALFVRIGVQPVVPPGLPAEAWRAGGYLATDSEGATPVRGLWACGDVTGSEHQSVAAASGGGARCATAIQRALGLRND